MTRIMTSIMSVGRMAFLAAGLLALAALPCGCKSMVEAMGYTVVDDELVEISQARDNATQEYVDITLPNLSKSFDGLELAKYKDLGETLKRVSRKEHLLLSGKLEADE